MFIAPLLDLESSFSRLLLVGEGLSLGFNQGLIEFGQTLTLDKPRPNLANFSVELGFLQLFRCQRIFINLQTSKLTKPFFVCHSDDVHSAISILRYISSHLALHQLFLLL